jgi:hypothetical protein
MGREIRRVPTNWVHPKAEDRDGYRPLFDRPYSKAISEWIENHLLWEAGKHPDQLGGTGKKYRFYAEWDGNAPKVERYRPEWTSEEATWYQVYETVSEGTPVTPPFATREELVEYLVLNGDFWDQKRRAEGNCQMPCQPWPRKQAEAFVFGDGWAPTLIKTADGKILTGIEALGMEE